MAPQAPGETQKPGPRLGVFSLTDPRTLSSSLSSSMVCLLATSSCTVCPQFFTTDSITCHDQAIRWPARPILPGEPVLRVQGRLSPWEQPGRVGGWDPHTSRAYKATWGFLSLTFFLMALTAYLALWAEGCIGWQEEGDLGPPYWGRLLRCTPRAILHAHPGDPLDSPCPSPHQLCAPPNCLSQYLCPIPCMSPLTACPPDG